MVKYKNYVVAVILGIALAFASIAIIGIGAALPVPAKLLIPLTQMSGFIAFVVVDFFTIAIPLAAGFLLFAFISMLFFKKNDGIFYLLLLAPMLLSDAYYFLQTQPQLDNIVPILPRYLLLAICFYYLVRSKKSVNT